MPESSRGSRWYGLGAVLVVVAVLAALVLLLRRPADDAVQPLFAHDQLKIWQAASPAVKQATAEVLLVELADEGKLGPRTQQAFTDPRQRQSLIDEMVDALDAAGDRNRSAYHSPAERIYKIAESALEKRGWNE